MWRLSCRFCRDELSQGRGILQALSGLFAGSDICRQGLQAPCEWAHIEWTCNGTEKKKKKKKKKKKS